MIYFDNSATTKPYPEVLETYVRVNTEYYGNASSLHNFGGKAEQLINRARMQIAELIHAYPDEIIFTSGGTEGNNLAIKGVANQFKNRGNHIITTAVEHSSVLEPCKQLEKMGFRITTLPVNQKGIISVDDLQDAISEETILVSVIHVNNEVGMIQPIKEIGKLLRKHPHIIFHVDHVQGAGKIPLDLHENDIDLCTFSAHKFHGLKGSGFLFKKRGINLYPQLTGGHQEQHFRGGTENVGGIVAMARAMRMIHDEYDCNRQKLQANRDFLYEKLQSFPNLIVHSPLDGAPHIVNFSAPGHKGEVIVHAMEEEGIILSTTSACSSKEDKPSHTLQAMGVHDDIARSAIRISLSYWNQMAEIEQFIDKLKVVLRRLEKVLERQ